MRRLRLICHHAPVESFIRETDSFIWDEEGRVAAEGGGASP